MREKLIELLLEVDSVCGARDCEGCVDDGICYVHRAADNLIANGVTVRAKGEWEFCHYYHSCSECGHIVGLISSLNFCPHCGVRMDGGV